MADLMMNQMSRLLGRAVLRRTTTSTTVRHFRSSRLLRANESEQVRAQDLAIEVKPGKFQKFVLVFTKFYKKMDDVPERISHQQMKLAYDYFRARTTIWFCVFGFACSYVMIVLGRRLRDSGDHLNIRGQKQIAEWREKGLEEERAAAAAANGAEKK